VAREFPRFAKDLLQWHIRTNGDFLVRDNPRWFVAFVWCEVLVQLPFFFVAAYAYAAGALHLKVINENIVVNNYL
jgi:hypothetical protein